MKDPTLNRRELLTSGLRWLLAPAVLGGTAVLATRKGETCTNQTICKTCGVMTTCHLPQALSYREATQNPRPERGEGRVRASQDAPGDRTETVLDTLDRDGRATKEGTLGG